jgi:hypothetical protein
MLSSLGNSDGGGDWTSEWRQLIIDCNTTLGPTVLPVVGSTSCSAPAFGLRYSRYSGVGVQQLNFTGSLSEIVRNR